MSFITIEYYIFLAFILLIVFLTPQKHKYFPLLIASYVFYASIHIEYSLVMFASTIVSFLTGILMNKVKKGRAFFFTIGILTDLSLLFFFKYFGFFLENINVVFGTEFNTNFSVTKHIILPIGISFYTFQSLAYTIDVFKRKRLPELNLGYYALFISFFPQLVAGPIERSQKLIPELKKNIAPKLTNIIQGGKLIIWGLFKKLVIADTLGHYVNTVIYNINNFNSVEVSLSAFAFAFQVYFDFSAYSNIAIGSAKMFGIDLSMNFNNPLTSKTMTELWSKWHITLMAFFNDYIFRPLIKSKSIFSRWKSSAILVVFFISGLWHGASWNFIIFGLINGIAIVLERETNFARKIRQKQSKNQLSTIQNIILIFYSLSILSLSAIWFKATTFEEAVYFLSRIINLNFENTHFFTVFYILALMFVGVAADYFRKDYQTTPVENLKYYILKTTVYSILIFTIILFNHTDDIPFVYYQF